MKTQAHVLIRLGEDEGRIEDDRAALQEWLSMRREDVEAHWTEEDVRPGRPDLEAILTDLRRERAVRWCSALVLVRLSDLSPSPGKLVHLMRELLLGGVSVVSVTENMVVERGGSLKATRLVGVLATIEQNHRRHVRQQAAKETEARGGHVGRPSYVWLDADRDHLRELLVAGRSVRQIAAEELLTVGRTNGTQGHPSATAIRGVLDELEQASADPGAESEPAA